MATSRENKTLSNFKSQLIGGGARPNLFEVELTTLPDAVQGWEAEKFRYLCKAAALPASNIANIDIPFRGRIFKVAGDRTFDVWTVTVINDEDFILRNAFESWMDQISKLSNNLGATEPASYMTDATVYQLGRGSTKSSRDSEGEVNAVLKEYKFIDIFPTAISAIDLSYDTGDAIEEFTVDFQVQTFELISGGPNG
mgnify:FL=1|tara:strand:+ start:311 stop:901 length:591 start_codon:yes stop_codon:yes gene_type:complete